MSHTETFTTTGPLVPADGVYELNFATLEDAVRLLTETWGTSWYGNDFHVEMELKICGVSTQLSNGLRMDPSDDQMAEFTRMANDPANEKYDIRLS